MNFIVEFLPKKSNGFLTVVVRDPKGFPLGVFDSLSEASVFIENQYHNIMEKYEKSDSKSDA